jgi:two-component system, NarL family, response regulator NreC
MISIVLADDHKVVRKGVKALLSAEPDFNVVGEVEDGLNTISLVERLNPDILVLDLIMPGMNGLEVTHSLNSRGSKTGIVILSMQNCDAYVCQALKFGAKAYVLKEAPPEELIKAIREVMAGRSYLCSALAATALIQEKVQKENIKRDPYFTLTPREKEIVILVAQGLSSKDIAAKLGLSIRTVETHRTNLMQKMKMHNQSQLMQYALQAGIISVEPNLLKM